MISASGCGPGSYGLCVAVGGGTGYSCETGACSPCPPGTFRDTPGALLLSDCLPCATGTFARSSSGSATCERCDAGSYVTDDAEDIDGIGVTGGGSACVVCPAGRAAAVDGSTSCIACDLGESSSSGSLACLSCDPGSFADGKASPKCRDCDAGRATPDSGTITCAMCVPGTASSAGATSCSPCPAGAASPTSGQGMGLGGGGAGGWGKGEGGRGGGERPTREQPQRTPPPPPPPPPPHPRLLRVRCVRSGQGLQPYRLDRVHEMFQGLLCVEHQRNSMRRRSTGLWRVSNAKLAKSLRTHRATSAPPARRRKPPLPVQPFVNCA